MGRRVPYVIQEVRDAVDTEINCLVAEIKVLRYLGPCVLNYAITRIVDAVYEPGYANIATITGVLENVKQEFYRRVAVLYEDKKMVENGDVYKEQT